ncbi:MAG: carbamoyltransferase [Halobacteriota archaeon]|nr:carbamoyltransferase [Halobacteriota archaeon]
MYILGISCYYHDAAACLLKDGKIVAAAQEERFTRKKHDDAFPSNAIRFCLAREGITPKQLDYVGFYDKPIVKFDRILETFISVAPKGAKFFTVAMPIWLRRKLWIRDLIRRELKYEGEIIFTEHHQSHAASAFFASPFEDAAILTVDGVGEWATTSNGYGSEDKITLTHEIRFPHSLGLLYSAFTQYLGFKVNSGEYKVMGLSPYGKGVYYDLIMENLIDLKEDGGFKLNMDYFAYTYTQQMINERFIELFGHPPREPESKIEGHHCDVAMSIQQVTEEAMIRMANHLYEEVGQKNLCLAGGVALNSVANGKILRETPFEEVYIQPAAGDAGGCIGVATFIWFHILGNRRDHSHKNNPSRAGPKKDFMQNAYLGPSYSKEGIKSFLDEEKVIYEELERDELLRRTTEFIADKRVVGWFQGRMEWGPRALGNRSIIADPRDEKMKDIINARVKFRESFRPFAPTVLLDHASEYFQIDRQSPYMLLVAQVKEDKRREIPAVTHVDGTARIQTISREVNPIYYDLIDEFYRATEVPVMLNTSFNVRGEPIVCTPRDAYACFIRTEMDHLVIGDFMIKREDQTPVEGKEVGLNRIDRVS